MSRRLMLALILVIAFTAGASAETWNADTVHSVLTFKVRHLFSKTGGTFGEWSGTFEFDGKNPMSLEADIVIQTTSVNTDNEDRDNHLRSKDFFNVESFPTMTFKSTKVEANGDDFIMHGELTMLGVTKAIEIPFEFYGAGKDPWGGVRAGFAGKTTVARKEFGMEWNKALDTGGMILGENISVDIEIELAQVGDES